MNSAGTILRLPEPNQSLQKHRQTQAGTGRHPSPRDPIRRRRAAIPGRQPASDPARA